MPDSPPVFSLWLRRQAALFDLLGDTRARRDRITLLVVATRSLLGWPFAAGLLLLLGVTAWHGATPGRGLSDLWQLFAPLFLAVSVLLGATIYAAEQRYGTFELLWLACGSGHALLRLKMTSIHLLFLFLVLPCSMLALSLSEVGLSLRPLLLLLFFLLTGAWFVLSIMAWLGTWFAQALSAGLLGAALFALLYLSIGGTVTSLNPFLNPFEEEAGRLLIMNRVLVIVGGWFFLRSAGVRLRRSF